MKQNLDKFRVIIKYHTFVIENSTSKQILIQLI
jgi:hypothetical protein